MKRIIIIILISGVLAFLTGCDPDGPDNLIKIIVLDDFDPDFTNPPFDDRVSILDYPGTLISQMTFSDFNVAGALGGHREVSTSRDGNYYAVCQHITNQGLIKYDMSGTLIFQARGRVQACCFYQTHIYALTMNGLIWGDGSFVVDASGQVLRRSTLSGYDLAIDELHNWVWFVGENVIRLDLDLNPMMTVDPIIYLANSVDTDSEGNAWICERDHPQIHESLNRVLKIATDGAILVTITDIAQPFCVRVDKSNQNIWVAHGSGISNFSPIGTPIQTITGSTSWSLEIDPNDYSVWVGTDYDVRHYSRNGDLLDIFTNNFSPNSVKFVAVSEQ
jgi:hypothetical protein